MAGPYEYWKDYRGVQIFRAVIQGEVTPGLKKPKYMYTALPNNRNLFSRSQQGIKAQIGRVMNGLTPTDCRMCVRLIPETPVSPERCAKCMECWRPYTCEWFEVRP